MTNATPAEFHSFRGSPLSPHAFVHNYSKGLELSPSPFDHSCIVHAADGAKLAAKKQYQFDQIIFSRLPSVVSTTMESQSEIGGPLWYHLVIPSDLGSARPVQDDIANLLAMLPLNPRDLAGIKIALEEALVNAIKHGNRHDREKKIVIGYKVSQENIVMCITDEGDGFDPTNVPDPTTPQNLERPSGRGVLLMRHYMTEVKYNDRGNSVEMTKVFKIAEDAS